jgi:rSAM/selenodomain-associated transferase 1
MKEKALIIFVKNPIPGEVKTRLGKTIGNIKAHEVYIELLKHTRDITISLNNDLTVYYSKHIDKQDIWDPNIYKKCLQSGSSLGERMKNAIKEQLLNHSSVILIGSDNYELNSKIIVDAFELLKDFDVCLGPSEDGGYYLIGMNEIHENLFFNKKWSTPDVFQDTVKDIKNLKLKLSLLPTLSDIDDEDDLKKSELMFKK